MNKSQFDVRHPFFRPVWRRAVFVGALALWTGYELLSQNWIWGALFAAATAYLAHQWFVVFDPKDYEDDI